MGQRLALGRGARPAARARPSVAAPDLPCDIPGAAFSDYAEVVLVYVAAMIPYGGELAAQFKGRRAGARYAMCAEDRLMNNVFWRAAARERLGVDPIVLRGGHSPMVARADELANPARRGVTELSGQTIQRREGGAPTGRAVALTVHSWPSSAAAATPTAASTTSLSVRPAHCAPIS